MLCAFVRPFVTYSNPTDYVRSSVHSSIHYVFDPLLRNKHAKRAHPLVLTYSHILILDTFFIAVSYLSTQRLSGWKRWEESGGLIGGGVWRKGYKGSGMWA